MEIPCHFICIYFKYRLIGEPYLPMGYFPEGAYYMNSLTFIKYSTLYRIFISFVFINRTAI